MSRKVTCRANSRRSGPCQFPPSTQIFPCREHSFAIASTRASCKYKSWVAYPFLLQGVHQPCQNGHVQQKRSGLRAKSRTGPVYAATAKGCRKAASCSNEMGACSMEAVSYSSNLLRCRSVIPGRKKRCKGRHVFLAACLLPEL